MIFIANKLWNCNQSNYKDASRSKYIKRNYKDRWVLDVDATNSYNDRPNLKQHFNLIRFANINEH